jgi:sugar/nucleoside kinase (ribokinase family)
MMQAAGGSAGNTVLALARLGSSAALLGRLGEDDTGRFFRACHSNAGARTDRRKSGPGASARCLSLITPAAQRTMMTDLGAAAGIGPADISEADFDARLVYSEGYVMYNRPYLDAVLDLARAAGAYIGFDLGSYSVVDMM